MAEPLARDLARMVGIRLSHPASAPAGWQARPWWRQSLAHGIPGIVLLHVELAARGMESWQPARDWLAAAVAAPVTSGADRHPYYGTPALAHALLCAAEQLPGAFQRVLSVLDRQILIDVSRRLSAAHARIDQGTLPALAEFDALRGLTGYGAYLLRRDPGGAVVRRVLEYLVRLVKPVRVDGADLPGWWTLSGPSGRADARFPGGHGNCGLAHGIAGVLSLVSLAARQHVKVGGQDEAIREICAWLDHWRTDPGCCAVWPYWVTRADLRASRPTGPQALRPSWCYGAAGAARAQQLAGLALGDPEHQGRAESTLIGALTDPLQLGLITDASLCHGHAGLAHVAARSAADALPAARVRLQGLIPGLLNAVQPSGTNPEDTAAALLSAAGRGPGLLDGAAGVALAVLAPDTGQLPSSGWDSCLLIA